MHQIRLALKYAQQKHKIRHLLVRRELRATPGNVFLERYGQLINLGRSGQLAMRRILDAHLERLTYDEQGWPVRVYPVTPEQNLEGPKRIAIDPCVSFGRPVLVKNGVSTAAIVDRIDAGESVEDVARDYGLEDEEVKEAIVYERAA